MEGEEDLGGIFDAIEARLAYHSVIEEVPCA